LKSIEIKEEDEVAASKAMRDWQPSSVAKLAGREEGGEDMERVRVWVWVGGLV
tara:strand:- start:650 stop:808 length:159 start_codon:yes stop_codon:yes gene_type:complete